MDGGTCPVRLLIEKFKRLIDEKFENTSGIVPVNKFLPKSRYFISVS